MKIVLSSKNLRNVIGQDFSHGAKNIHIETSDNSNDVTLRFESNNCNGKDPFIIGYAKFPVDETIPFNNLGMAKLYSFLNLVSEQPLRLEIDEYTIRCTQFVIDFI